jgi:RimJ/RimL family protein N-acetyltransferase
MALHDPLNHLTHPLMLRGQTVTLEPLGLEHIAPLMNIAVAHPEDFLYTSTPTNAEEAESYFARAFAEREAGLAYPFVILRGGLVVGTSRYAAINYGNRNCEVGFTWLDPGVRGTTVNAESKYLMLEHAFEGLDFLRVYLYADARNVRSQRAIRKLGAVYEGTLRAERVMKDGFIRDTQVYSVLYNEWPEVKRTLKARLALASAVDAHG